MSDRCPKCGQAAVILRDEADIGVGTLTRVSGAECPACGPLAVDCPGCGKWDFEPAHHPWCPDTPQ